jgi:4-diphosphocytidyl-2-C-methyl-D-erythritol kinase
MKIAPLVTHQSSLSLNAPAKINWFLKVIGIRNDGYHNIISLMQCISLYDELIFKHSDKIDVVSNLAIKLKDNLVYKAASLLKQYTSYRYGVKIVLHKDIPAGAGLGGGSSDAAYTLSGLNILWGLGLNTADLSSIAAEIGSDVPFFLNTPCALTEGRGEKISPWKMNSSVILLLIKPRTSVSTSWAYASFDKLKISDTELTKKHFDIKLFCQAFENRDFAYLSNMMNNDFEKVIIRRYPVVDSLKKRLLEKGAIMSAMTGSGPTVFGVFDSRDAAEKAFEAMKPFARGGWGKIVQTLV